MKQKKKQLKKRKKLSKLLKNLKMKKSIEEMNLLLLEMRFFMVFMEMELLLI